jgi:signal peptidase I
VSGQGDDQAERAILASLQKEPLDVLGLLGALRKRLGDLLALREGAVHPLLHRLVRSEKVIVTTPSERGLARYRLPDAPDPDGPEAVPPLEPVASESQARAAMRVASGARDPAARGRIQADVLAHLESLGDKAERFGSPRSLRTLVYRVSRGKPTVCLTAGAGDSVRRFLLHEGPWIAGAALLWIVLKVFVVQTYVIPSGSMIPTLLPTDRVVVFRFEEGEAQPRWTVATFDKGDKILVKRVVGLGGEEIYILHGDVYADGTLLVKPDDLREQLREPLGSWDLRAMSHPPGWTATTSADGKTRIYRSGPFDAHPPCLGAERGGVFAMRDGYARLALGAGDPGPVRLTLSRGPGERADAGADKGTIQWSLELVDGGVRLEEARVDDGQGGGPSPAALIGEATQVRGVAGSELELSYVDGILRARARDWSFEQAREAPDGPLTVTLEVAAPSSGPLRLSLDRDLHYVHVGDHAVPQSGHHGKANPHEIPAGRLFFLGDNSADSRDSRFSDVGDVPVERVVGRVSYRIWPPSRWGRVR